MRFQFYETAILAEFNGSATVGVQVLTSPSDPVGDGTPVPYETILDDFEQVRALDSSQDLFHALTLVADPLGAWQEAFVVPELSMVPRRNDASAFADALMSEPLIPAETSPFDKKTLIDLAAIAGSSGFIVATGGAPLVVLIGGGVGFVVVRGLEAVGGALWEGARPEVVELGGDIGAKIVGWIRRRLNLKRRRRRR